MTQLDTSAAEALRLATIAPVRARGLALKVHQAARTQGEWATVSVAARAVGLAALQLRDLDAAAAYLRASVAAAERAGSRTLVGEARMSLAATHLVRGSPMRSIKVIDAALADLDGVAAARARTQRAAIFQVLGRNEEALADLRQALPVLRQSGDVQWETRARTNRSLLLITRRSFSAAEADLLVARQLCADNGLELATAYAEQNLGCLKASRGEVVAALEHFDRAEAGYRQQGLDVGSLEGDRAELLLSVRLVDEARAAAESAVAIYQAQKRSLSIPDARLLLSTVALVQGDSVTAEAAAEQAARAFRRLGRQDGLALARYARVQATIASRPQSVTASHARRCAAELAAAGWIVPSLEARVLAGRLALRAGRRDEARTDLALASRARFAGPADARARAWFAEALLRRADGRRRAAVAALSAGLRIVEEHQATLGATELRAHVSVHRGSLANLGVLMAIEDGNARRVLAWAERGRASALLLRAPAPPEDDVLARDLADLRMTMIEIEEHRSAGRPAADLVRRQVHLERAIAARCRRFPAAAGSTRPRPRAIGELAIGLRNVALVEYVEIDDRLYAVTLVEGKARLHLLGSMDAIRAGLTHLPFALRRLANPESPKASIAGATLVLTRAREKFDQLLLRPVAAEIGDRPLVIVPTGILQSLPWSILPHCAGRSITVIPSATVWLNAAEAAGPGAGARVGVVAGPGLPGAREEAEAVADMYPNSWRLLDGAATVASLCAAMDGAALVHIAAHGRLRSDNPLFSSLLMADGPLTVYDLERLDRAPYQVVLASCDTARSHVIAGDEVLGLAGALLTQGTASLVAPLLPVLDAVTGQLMHAYHRGLLAGRSPAHALARAQQEARAQDVVSWAAAASFVCIGVGLDPAGE